jgi:DnaJ family protein C protein 28
MTSAKQKKRQQQLNQLKEKLEEHQLAQETSEQPTPTKRAQERADLIEQRIQEAMANGEFDNLRGKGKPLAFASNPYVDPAQGLAFSLLQNNDLAPEWIERDKEIRREIEIARQQLRQAWQVFRAQPAQESAWQAAVTRFEEALQKINRKIDSFNLTVPIVTSQRFRLHLESELQGIQHEKD